MNKKRIIARILVSPFVLGILTVSYTIGCLRRWCNFLWHGGEFITYEKNDSKAVQDIFNLMKKDNTEPIKQIRSQLIDNGFKEDSVLVVSIDNLISE